MKLLNDVQFSSDMLMELIIKVQEAGHYEELNTFQDEKCLDTLSRDEIEKKLEKSLAIEVSKVEKIVGKSLVSSDLVKLAHCAISMANECQGDNSKDSGKKSNEKGKKRKLEEPSVSYLFLF